MARRVVGIACAVGFLAAAAPAWAEGDSPATAEAPTVSEPPKPAGVPAEKKGKAAWSAGDMGGAEVFYREAIAKGGLAPDEVLEAYVRLGTARLLLGRKEQALAAYKAAAVIDNAFSVPSEGGPKAETLATIAKKEMSAVGTLVLGLSAPSSVKGGKAFRVRAKIDDTHSRVLTRLGLSTKDGSGKELYLSAKPAPVVEFEVPAESVVPGGTLVVRVDALDSHDNRLASAESRVEVTGTKPVVVAKGPAGAPAKPEPQKKEGGGFFSSPWTYIVGGALLAGAGATVFILTRPGDDVTVGAVSVRAR